jgi:mannitol 2-dehydrogenase
MSDIYGDVGTSKLFADAFAHSLKALWEAGTRQTLTHYLSGAL